MPKSNLRKRATRATMRAYHSLRHRALDAGLLPGDADYTRFICIGYARTGSTLLMRSLNNHSRIVGFGEIVKNVDRYPQHYHEFENSQALFEANPVRFLSAKVFRKYPPQVDAVGFKIFYHHAPRDMAWGRCVWDYLLGQPDLKVLHLKRRNLLKTLLSEKQAGETEEWIKYSGNGADAPVIIDPAEAAAFFARLRAWEAEYDTLFAGHALHEVIYEQLTRDLPGELARIQTFLGVSHETLNPGTEKRPIRTLASQITNYAALKARFQGTLWAEFFTE